MKKNYTLTSSVGEHSFVSTASEGSSSVQNEWSNNRILVVDDELKIVSAYSDIFCPEAVRGDKLKSLLKEFNIQAEESVSSFQLDSVASGMAAVEKVKRAVELGKPYAVIFMDVRMPPGIDGVEAAEMIRQIDEDVYIIFVSAYSDYSAYEMQCKLEKNMLLIPKPFEGDSIRQMAYTLCMIWEREHSLSDEHQRLKSHSKLMEHQATHDGLTGVYNRHYLNTVLEVELSRAYREQTSVGVLMADIDWFKRYNDHYGHLEGDRILRKIAKYLASTVNRAADFVARFGGEEFCIVLPNTDRAGVEEVAERIRLGIEELKIEFTQSDTAPWMTVSVGGTYCIPESNEKEKVMEQVLSTADRLLYEVKKSGKNRCLVESC